VHAGSSLYGLDGDALERLEPDLIVTQELCAVCAVSYEIVDRAAKRLHHDARIVSLEPASLDDVFANILYLGTLTGREAGARQVVTALEARVTALRERTSQAVGPRPRVLLLEWTDPPMGGGHWTPGLVELAGGDCILGNPGGNAPTLSWDAIAAVEPQAIVVVPCGYDVDRSREAARELETNIAYTSLPAYRKGRILAMDGNVYVSRPGPRLVDSAEIIADFLERTDRE
jgi:iron complex transport system substrate-binding protein